jgi:hypothetical protein
MNWRETQSALQGENEFFALSGGILIFCFSSFKL